MIVLPMFVLNLHNTLLYVINLNLILIIYTVSVQSGIMFPAC